MAIVKFIETRDSRLESIPIKQGQFIWCYDSGDCFRDTQSARIKVGADIIILNDGDDLPLAPIKNKIYVHNHRYLYIYITSISDWVSLSNVGIDLADNDNFEPLGG
ncbi:MAG: hypothetical protein LUH21_17655 [Clostridiales bacterium]|nr:hypothetical protein [Clostridiales bacterium]